MRRWLPPLMLAIASAIWLAWSFPRLHPSARLGLQFDRAGYLDQARQLAAGHGADLTAWRGYVQPEALSNNQRFRGEFPRDEIAQTFPTGDVIIEFLSKEAGSAADLTLRPDARPLEWKLPPAKIPGNAGARAAAESAMRQIAGRDAANYRMTATHAAAHDETGFVWQRFEPSPETAHARIEASVKNGVARQAKAVFDRPENFAKRIDALAAPRMIIVPAWYTALIVALVVSIFREGGGNVARAMKDSSAARLGVVMGLATAAAFLIDWGDFLIGAPEASGVPLSILIGLLATTVFGLLSYTALATTVLNARLHPLRVRGLRLLPTQAIFSRTAGAELLGGWLSAAALVSIPLAVSAALREPLYGGYNPGTLLSRAPALGALIDGPRSGAIPVLFLFGLLIPLGLRVTRVGWLSRIVIALSALLTFGMLNTPFPQSQAANLLCAALTALLMLWVYLRFGMLGALTAFCSANILTSAGAFLTQPAPALHSSGLKTLAALAGFGVFALVSAWKGPEVLTELPGESGVRLQTRSRREELLAEFNVARSAQQQMLPSKPPAFAGYTIAASCEPAREVGGDLYDFLRLSDGRWGIGVADVSGKGVPAALYMTLTKGLLCAAAQDSTDPREILMSVNKHLRAAARKKVFVTMALGVLDPAARTLEYVRAGHNPVVWRRPATDETLMLTSSGVGLGLTSPSLFARTLAIEKIDLAPGDALIFYSDGLTEAMTESQEQFGEERLMAAAARADGLHAAATRDSILGEVRRFLGGAQSQDDLTIAVLRVNADIDSNGR